MEPNQFIRKIRRYSLFSFLLPLIAINLCLFIYTLLGKVDTFPNGNDYSKKIIQHTLERYIQLNTDMENRTFTNCPKTKIKTYVHTDDSQKLLLRDLDLHIRNKTGLPVHVAEEPLLSVVKGTGIVLGDIKRYSNVLLA